MFNTRIYIKQETTLFTRCQSCWICTSSHTFFYFVRSKNSEKNYAQLDGSRIIQTYITAVR